MLTYSNIALSLALVLGTASVATAAPKHSVHHHLAAGARQVPSTAYRSYGSVRGTGQAYEPSYMSIQDQDWKNQIGG
jgi:hypothetical protein